MLYFNFGVECEEQHNYGEYFPYCEDCDALVRSKREEEKKRNL